MKLSDNITKEHILKATEAFDKGLLDDQPKSTYYDVFFNEKRYPPKVLIAYAHQEATGEEIETRNFSGGKGSPCFRILEKEGFQIIEMKAYMIKEDIKF